MSVERVKRKGGEVVWRVRWRDGGRRNRSCVLGRKRDAEAFDAEIRRRKRTGELAALDGGRETLDEYVAGTWSRAHAAHLEHRGRARPTPRPTTATSRRCSARCACGRSTPRRSPPSRVT